MDAERCGAAAEADADHCLFRSQSHNNGTGPLLGRTRAHSPDPPASCAVEPTRECCLCCFGLLRGSRSGLAESKYVIWAFVPASNVCEDSGSTMARSVSLGALAGEEVLPEPRLKRKAAQPQRLTPPPLPPAPALRPAQEITSMVWKIAWVTERLIGIQGQRHEAG